MPLENQEEQIKALKQARTHLHRATELLDRAGLHHITQELFITTESVTQEMTFIQNKGAQRNGD